ncbi:unnamed protein product, partial [Vitis vinifera]|uniref:Transcription repressor n=1 Tax=Vitis vinifera TaxID=29760 RepID=D7SPG4_VITVI
MARRFKLRISRVIPSFQSCRSKDPSSLPENPVPVSSRQCFSDDDDSESPEFKWKKEDKWHVVAKVYDDNPRQKIYNSSVSGESDDDVLPPPPPPTAEKKKRRSKKKKAAFRVRMSTSSADISSSRSFSTDSSSEFNPHLETIREMPMNGVRRKKKKNAKKVKKTSGLSSPESESPARLSMFQRLIPCTVDGKVRESFAVVKKSEDPYEDFKRSMMEMILEKQMFEEKDLEQLLHCFLSLNSRHHHGVIVEAFTEIWDVLFCKPPTHKRAIWLHLTGKGMWAMWLGIKDHVNHQLLPKG